MSIAEVVREAVETRLESNVLRRWFLWLGLGTALLVLFSSGAVVLYGFSQGEHIYPGVRVAGVDVGGLSREEAERRVEQALRGIEDDRIEFLFRDQRVSVPVRELAPRWDVPTAVEQAYRRGRTGNLWEDSGQWLRALLGREQVSVPVEIDTKPLQEALQRLAAAAARPPQNAQFVYQQSDVTVTREEVGYGIDVTQAVTQARLRLGAGQTDTITLDPVELQPEIRRSDLEVLLPQVRTLVAEPATLELNGEPRWVVSPTDLVTLLTVRQAEGALQVEFDRARLESYFERIANDVVVQPQNATVRWNGQAFEVVPGRPGAILDVSRTVDEFVSRLFAGERRVPVQARPADPEITTAMAGEAQRVATRIVDHGVTVHWPGGERVLRGPELATLLAFAPQRQGDRVVGLSVELDRSAARTILESFAPSIRVEARDAVLRYIDGRVRVVRAEQVGRELDIDASLESLDQAIRTGQDRVELVTRTVEPKIASALASQIVIRERISSGATYYGDSAPNRRYNVELAVERVNGALVPPGEVFSFNQTVGPINLDAGFKVGYGIVATNGRVQTVPSVGGGVCQVSTTLFHAAFWGGFPIVERNWHLYWIPLYGQPPSGLIGLDATVDTDYGLDFKFRNATNDWIAIVAWADGQWVHFEIWGTKPNWRVEVDDPVVTNVVKADPTPVFRESTDLAPGEQVVVERARDGFSVVIRRRVYEGDRLIDDLTLRSTYQPSQNVTLVGPQPSPTPTATPEETPTGTTTPVPETPGPGGSSPTPVPPTPTP